MLLISIVVAILSFIVYVDVEQEQLNPLFFQWVNKFEIIPDSHILTPIVHVEDYKGYQFYSAYGVFFPKNFTIPAHRDYHCSLCDGDFKAIMIPRTIHSKMAKICHENGCEDFTKGYAVVNVCDNHWTQPGIIDRAQINLYYTNSTKCAPLGQWDEFDCEAKMFGNKSRMLCSTTNPFLVSLVKQRNLHWNHV